MLNLKQEQTLEKYNIVVSSENVQSTFVYARPNYSYLSNSVFVCDSSCNVTDDIPTELNHCSSKPYGLCPSAAALMTIHTKMNCRIPSLPNIILPF